MKKPCKIFFLVVINLFICSAYCQSAYSKKLLFIEQELNLYHYDNVKIALEKINETSLSKRDRAFYNYLSANYYNSIDRPNAAFKYFLVAEKLYTDIDSVKMAMDINLDIANVISGQDNNMTDYKKYFDKYATYAKKSGDPYRMARVYMAEGNFNADAGNGRDALNNYKKALTILYKINNRKVASELGTNIGAIYTEYLKMPDSALYYLKKSIPDLKKYSTQQELFYNYGNQAAAYQSQGKYDKAIEYLKISKLLHINNFKSRINVGLNESLYKNYDAKGDYKNAYIYLKAHKEISDSLNMLDQSIAINDIQTKYSAKEKELENDILKSKIKTDRIVMYAIIFILLAIVTIALLIIKNSRRREKISRQEKLIEQQKFEKTLKEYELNSIDMMLEGQEKERQRIANDLHDNLGSMLATLKFNFENLKLRKIELREEENKLYDRTDELIEEAYQKVRGIAHAKNAGVFASEGLIPAIQKLAEKISIPNKLQIQVIPFGFTERLENTLEITIFRTIQEMVTNIVKHSQATEATIHLTNHDDNINIIIEDNGIGFESSKVTDADGMGLQNIKKKIIQLGGTLEIDTTPGKGTTIIIDIPVND